eukprot:COSAG01_NODE_216_length_21695_cov_83.368772_3_plen_265_part_00
MCVTKIFGILNITPDSFSDGGLFLDEGKAFRKIEAMISAGADGIDVGASSSRPGALSIDAETEIARLKPVLSQFKKRFDVSLSLDTYHADVAAFGVDCGINILNDISALRFDQGMASVVAKAGVLLVLMHMQGQPKSMQQQPSYTDVVSEVYGFFEERLAYARSEGIEHCILDPGIGFGKTLTHNLLLLRDLSRFISLNCPVMLGTSRKSFIDHLHASPVSARLGGSLASIVLARQAGVSYLRVHDVYESKQACIVADAIEDRV